MHIEAEDEMILINSQNMFGKNGKITDAPINGDNFKLLCMRDLATHQEYFQQKAHQR